MKSYSIGRDLSCDIVLNDQSDVVSRRHAILTVSSSGKMTITDQSSNGTYVNGIKVSPNVPVPVTRKDSISFAHVATLDWNMIPKSRMWVNYLAIALGMAAIASLLVLFLTRERNPDNKPEKDETIVTDTLKSQPQADSTKMEPIKPKLDTVPPKTDSIKQNPQTEQKPKKQNSKKQNSNTENKNNKPKAKTDSVKSNNNPRPFGV